MREKLNKKREKLIPLRRFAVDGLYNAPYLSILVQRNKLKAQKIGRNYYTTKAWFKEYLDLHSRDEKREDYYKFLETLDEDLNTSKKTKKVIKKLASNQQKKSDDREASFFVFFKSLGIRRIMSSFFIGLGFVGIVYVVSTISMNMHFQDQGQVAGVEEVGSSTDIILELDE